eukprot:TRINITY_DN7459_c0_g2_i1.p1 TRINITY_DN7459_c0_g2~~TRINITY_DN7459_c0_g2_i1.p1  ORF type:complete len:347 (-),score=106.91 TRINITY_DN7459_c0_g2_i1:607-1647(-)
MEAFGRGNALFVDDDFEGALDAYNEAVAQEPRNSEFLVKRSACLFKLGKYKESLADAEVAAQENESAAALFRKGSALFYLDKFGDAFKAFTAAKRFNHPQADLWLRKCQAEITSADPVEGQVPVLGDDDKAQSEPQPPAPKLAEKMKYAWVQDAEMVNITYYAKKLKPSDVDVQFSAKNVTVRLHLQDGSVYESPIQLFGEIDASASKVTTTDYKVILYMKKASGGHWDDLFTKDAGNVVKRENIRGRFEGPSYPSSSLKKKDWSALEKEAVREDETEKPSGDAALNKLFQDIYSKADDDTRRAMIKSFQTSGGTVLSTNWKEVGTTNYEETIQAPKGMEVHRWKE